MKINVANLDEDIIQFLIDKIGVRATNEKNLFNTQLVLLVDGNYKYAGYINKNIMEIHIDKIKNLV